MDEPFKLAPGALVQVRVSAKNEIGWSNPSLTNSEESRLVEKPPIIDSLIEIKKNLNDVVIQWTPIT